LTVGNFDGVHLGHQELVRRVVTRARQRNIPSVVMTFEPHPVKVLHPDRKLHRIFDLEDQVQMLESLGIDALVIEPFSREFSQLPPERYLLEWIYRPFVPELVVVGYDFSFGANRQGSIDFLSERAKALGFEVDVVPPVKIGDVLVSSSRIRQALEAGDVGLAAQLLGRKFYLKGLVEKGAGRGRKIGVPTANLRTAAESLPAQGVYAAWAEARGAKWMAAVNIGYNPTFNEGVSNVQPSTVEAHLIGFPGAGQSDDIYGLPLKLEFVERLREERKFASVDALVDQIKRDVQTAREILGGA
jgi:riboflavin kinase/FMN adenylyltransferase